MGCHSRIGRGFGRIVVLVGGGLAAAGPVCAQSPGAAQPSTTAEIADVVVTATRLQITGFEAPTPTTVVSAEDIQKSAPVNVADYVNSLPQLAGSLTPQSTGTGVGGGLGGANVLNLRDLGTTRTLVLLDGRRVVGAGPTGAVDINLFPADLISRVDVVTGGASAAWGSDAVGGVVNFILNTHFTGLKAEVQGGESTYGDAANERAALSYGTSWAGDRGHLIVSGLVSNADGIARADSRPWYTSTKLVRNPAWVLGNGQPYYLVASNVGLATATDGGLITSGPLKGTTFGPNGTTSPFTYGTSIPGGAFQLGGTPVDYAGKLSLLAATQQQNLFAHGSYDFSDRTTGYLEAQYGRSRTPYLSGTPGQATGLSAPQLTIQSDNAYLPAAVGAQMASNHMTSFTLGRTDFDGLVANPVNTRQLVRVVAGVDGKLSDDWKWSLYDQYGETFIDNNVYNNTITARLPLAADAVLVTSSNVGSSGLAVGSIACRSTLTHPGNGCVPENVFGYGAPSAASLAWLTGEAHQAIKMKENVAAAQVNVAPFSTWAGPAAAAAGVETRHESMQGDADPVSQTNGWFVGNYHPLSGSYSVSEAFLETDLPLLSQVPLVRSVDLDAAARYTRYSVSGSATTWKVGLNWKINDDVSFRGTRSRDIRAPNLNDLFLAAQTNTATVTDPQNGSISDSILVTTRGNTGLTPEIADSRGLGMVLRPHWLPGFGASIDYYTIEIKQAIASFNAQQIINDCYTGQAVFCPAVTRTNGQITAVTVQEFNANSEIERGLDIELSYRTALGGLHLPGDIALRALAANVQHRAITANGVTTDLLGELQANPTVGPPRWKGMLVADYHLGPSATSLTARFIGPGVMDNTFVQGGNASLLSINDNHIRSVTYFDLSETWILPRVGGADLQVFFVVQNLLNADPPTAVSVAPLNQAVYGTSNTYYDLIGRQFRLGIRLQL